MHTFRLPIGDWSNDGHGHCEYYLIFSNKPLEEVREAHFQIEKVTGINIHSIANKYEEHYVDSEHPVIPYLLEKGVLFDFFEEPWEDDYADMYSIGLEQIRNLWLYLLEQADPTLKLTVEANPPMLPFYGVDEQKRHIDFVGYGLFD